ncbi:hypothetical protein EJ08DRAFT_695130 [Tothia fuscella]|uniref:Uncharacterized protein n=1 Tax=Tothia fuscella TaxID=1048955 RepID=A0A9P4NX29_9PEZI|nr:hypothetical protein EJ08DRAFT_695130 [Tothia fuscella]
MSANTAHKVSSDLDNSNKLRDDIQIQLQQKTEQLRNAKIAATSQLLWEGLDHYHTLLELAETVSDDNILAALETADTRLKEDIEALQRMRRKQRTRNEEVSKYLDAVSELTVKQTQCSKAYVMAEEVEAFSKRAQESDFGEFANLLPFFSTTQTASRSQADAERRASKAQEEAGRREAVRFGTAGRAVPTANVEFEEENGGGNLSKNQEQEILDEETPARDHEPQRKIFDLSADTCPYVLTIPIPENAETIFPVITDANTATNLDEWTQPRQVVLEYTSLDGSKSHKLWYGCLDSDLSTQVLVGLISNDGRSNLLCTAFSTTEHNSSTFEYELKNRMYPLSLWSMAEHAHGVLITDKRAEHLEILIEETLAFRVFDLKAAIKEFHSDLLQRNRLRTQDAGRWTTNGFRAPNPKAESRARWCQCSFREEAANGAGRGTFSDTPPCQSSNRRRWVSKWGLPEPYSIHCH